MPTFRIAKSTYNDLGPAWIEHSVFSFEIEGGK